MQGKGSRLDLKCVKSISVIKGHVLFQRRNGLLLQVPLKVRLSYREDL